MVFQGRLVLKILKIIKNGWSGWSLRPWLSKEPQSKTMRIFGVFFALKLFSFCSNDFFSKFYRLIQVPRRSTNFGIINIIQHVSRLTNAGQGTRHGLGSPGQGLEDSRISWAKKNIFILFKKLLFKVMLVNISPPVSINFGIRPMGRTCSWLLRRAMGPLRQLADPWGPSLVDFLPLKSENPWKWRFARCQLQHMENSREL